MQVEALIFDIGNVLVRFEPGKAERTLAELGARDANLDSLSLLGRRYEVGEFDRAAFLEELRKELAVDLPDETLARAWQDIFSPNEPMCEIVDKLHGRYPLYLLSNTNCLHHEHLLRAYPVFAKFRDGVFSYRAKMMKPERGIFELAIRQFGVRPEAAIYLDDLAANVEAARAAGLRAFLYRGEDHEDLAATLRAQGVQCV